MRQPGAERMGGGVGRPARHLERPIALLWGLLPEASTAQRRAPGLSTCAWLSWLKREASAQSPCVGHVTDTVCCCDSAEAVACC